MKTANTTTLNYPSNLNFHQILYIICWSLWQLYSLIAFSTKQNYICVNMKATLCQAMYNLNVQLRNLLYGTFNSTLQKHCVIVAIHTEITQQGEKPKFKIWAMPGTPQSRNNTKWEPISVLPLGNVFQSELIIRHCQALLCLKKLWDQLIPHSLMLSHLCIVASFPKIHNNIFVPTWATYYCYNGLW